MRGLLVALAGAAVGVSGMLAACSMDFEQFNPVDASAEVSAADATTDSQGAHESGPLPGNEAASADADGGEAASDALASADSQGPADATSEDAACRAPPGCFAAAQTCGAACSRTLQQCMVNCIPTQCSRCTSQQQTCIGQCATTCINCTQDGGCLSSNDCLDAARSGQ